MRKKKPTVLEEAIAVVSGPRQAVYGPPTENWACTAEIASAITGVPVTAEFCVLIALAMKLARRRRSPKHRDTLVDLPGYVQVLAYVEGVDSLPSAHPRTQDPQPAATTRPGR